ncbi:phosphotransferase [Actinomadura sediminis]|uniref:Phosphotransferase n=1 Tax=Actinomadura sediminis TaxID=1038904 RepID=A0ABW3EVK4_9ACTN
MSAVERLHLDDGGTVILKTAVDPFTAEARILEHAARHKVPVPEVLAATVTDNRLMMLLEDLGEPPEQDPPVDAGAHAATLVHACPPLSGLPLMDAPALAALPRQALATLTSLQEAGRWDGTEDVAHLLERLSETSERRAAGTDTPPFGMCHSEFHPTSLHTGPAGTRVLDWARAFTGPGLLDLASWRDTPLPLDIGAIAGMIEAYIAAGGTRDAGSRRGGVPAEVWAGGWHRVWICDWYLQQCQRWMPDPGRDEATQRTVRRHLAEAVECLT